jgi:hydroxymethylpyrimidine/phosphomethylpyrimidine kinase
VSETPPADERTPRVLSIAGSDSGGGAGIQADLKAFARCGVHGMTAITAVTAQNTVGVDAIHAIPPEIVLAQVRAVVRDIGVDAVKLGMLGSREVIDAVAQALDELPAEVPIVVDPVMVAESGARLLDPAAHEALVLQILPRASVLTPNIPEARALAGAGGGGAVREPAADEPGARESEARESEAQELEAQELEAQELEAQELIRAVLALGPQAVVLTGGHRSHAHDLFLARDGDGRPVSIEGERHPDGAAHGSGCTHASLLAARLALGDSPLQAARAARELAGVAVAQGLRDVGAGAGPVDVLGIAGFRRAGPRRLRNLP